VDHRLHLGGIGVAVFRANNLHSSTGAVTDRFFPTRNGASGVRIPSSPPNHLEIDKEFFDFLYSTTGLA
jgi:hypothetical protein